MSDEHFDLAVAGAGIVGMSTALWAQMAGLKVVICDAKPPGSGATYGSACTIATYANVPINSPGIFRALPQLLLDRDSPLSVNPSFMLQNFDWMRRFLSACRPKRVEEIAAALGAMLRHADGGLDPLIAASGAEDLVAANDCLYVWSSEAGYRSAAPAHQLRARSGISYEVISAEAVRALEPNLKMPIHRGLLFKGARHILNPQSLVERFHRHFLALGGQYRPVSVTETRADPQGVTLILGDGSRLRSRDAVISAGAHSKSIKGAGLEKLPLGAERGYHIAFAAEGHRVSRPVGWAEAGLYATPMTMGLRLAGTVELDRLDAPANPRRLAYLRRRAAQMFGDLGPPQQEWLGLRPTMPDALPVIGRAPSQPRLIYAFGHQHIGLTLGGVTGRIITGILQGEQNCFDLSPFSPTRF